LGSVKRSQDMGQKATLLDLITSPLIYINAQLSSHPGPMLECSATCFTAAQIKRCSSEEALVTSATNCGHRVSSDPFVPARPEDILQLPHEPRTSRQDSRCGRVSRLLDQCSCDNAQNYRELELSNVIGSPLFPVCLTGCSISVTEAELAALRVVGRAVFRVRTRQ